MKKIWSKADRILELVTQEPVGALMFQGAPSVMVYGEGRGHPFIMEWIGSTPDGTSDTYMWYEVTRYSLKAFIAGTTDMLGLEQSAISQHYYVQEIVEDHLGRPELIPIEELPDSCWANPGVRFKLGEATNLDRIEEAFDLANATDDRFSDIEDLSITLGRGIYYLHLKHSKGVGLGHIDTDKLTRALTGFNELYREAALDLVHNRDRGDIKHSAANAEHLEGVATETLSFMRASFGVVIKPYDTTLFSAVEAETHSNKILDLLNGIETNGANKFVEEWSPFTVEKYNAFLGVIKKDRLDVDMVWTHQRKTTPYSIDDAKAAQLQQQLKSATAKNVATIKDRCIFQRLHVDTNYFLLATLSGVTYRGKFDDLLKDNLARLTFTDVYEVTMEQVTTVTAGKSDTETVITSCLVVKPLPPLPSL